MGLLYGIVHDKSYNFDDLLHFSLENGDVNMAVGSETTPLKAYRLGFSDPKVSQETMARKATIVLQTYRRAEDGRPCSYSTAKSILQALNAERERRRMEPLVLDRLGLNIV